MKKHSRKKPQQNKLGENKKEGTFFNKTNDTQPQAVQKKEDSRFFQAKSDGIKLGKPGDKFEQEADSTAEDVVNKKEGDSPQLMEDSVNGIQRYMTNAQEDELGSNTMRIEKDKYIQSGMFLA